MKLLSNCVTPRDISRNRGRVPARKSHSLSLSLFQSFIERNRSAINVQDLEVGRAKVTGDARSWSLLQVSEKLEVRGNLDVFGRLWLFRAAEGTPRHRSYPRELFAFGFRLVSKRDRQPVPRIDTHDRDIEVDELLLGEYAGCFRVNFIG